MKKTKEELDDALCELEEMNECGDLEDRLEAALKVAELQQILKINKKSVDSLNGRR